MIAINPQAVDSDLEVSISLNYLERRGYLAAKMPPTENLGLKL